MKQPQKITKQELRELIRERSEQTGKSELETIRELKYLTGQKKDSTEK